MAETKNEPTITAERGVEMPFEEWVRLVARAPETKRQRDALLASLKAAMRGPMSVVKYHTAQALIADCENGSAD